MAAFGRIALIAGAAVAAVSVGIATLRPTAAPLPVARAHAAPDIGQMIARIETRLKTNPDDVEGWRMLGLAFYQVERFAESATAYKRATQIAPAIAENWANLGEALVMAGKGDIPADALAAFRTALARDAKDVRARYFIAVHKDIVGDHEGAINGWIALLKDAPPNAPWEADVRNLVTQVGAKQKIDVTSRLAAIRPQERPGVAAMPNSEQDAMIASMVDGLAKKLEIDPKNADGWIMLIRSYKALGRPADAESALQKAITANPDSAPRLKAAVLG